MRGRIDHAAEARKRIVCCFERLDSPAKRAYGDPGAGSHYQGQSGPTISAREDELHRRGPDSPARW